MSLVGVISKPLGAGEGLAMRSLGCGCPDGGMDGGPVGGAVGGADGGLGDLPMGTGALADDGLVVGGLGAVLLDGTGGCNV